MKAEGRVLVCFPLKQEAAPFRKVAASGLRHSRLVSVLLTGIGRRNAERALRNFLNANPADLVLTCGFAGGLNPDLKLGDVVFELCGSEIGNRQSAIGNHLLAAGAKPARFFCAGHIATTVTEKKKLRDETGADAVEMESAAIYAVCREHNIPCATVRVISDTASEDLPLDFNQLSRPDQSLDYGKLFLTIAKSPGKIGALMKLQKQTQFAAERLAEVLAGTL
jgi:adenosylhomocysteine nucleosidase